MTIAEKITRAKTDYDEVYEAGILKGETQGYNNGFEAGKDAYEKAVSQNYTNYSYYFYNLTKRTEIPEELIPKHTQNSENFDYMMNTLGLITTAPLFDTSNGKSFRYFLGNCQQLTTVPLYDLSNATDVTSFFTNGKRLTAIPNLNTANVTAAESMFLACEKLQEIPQLNFSNLKNAYSMFNGCKAIKTIPQLDFSSVTNASSMFNNCTALETLPRLDFTNVSSLMQTFQNCANLKQIGMLIPPQNTNSSPWSYTFKGCTSLQTLNIGGDIKNSGIDLSPTTVISHDSIMNVINALSNYAGTTKTYKATFGTTNLAKLTDTEKAIATAKGWTLA